ncbi:hypothetical protein BS17DRAFT_246713 [Gyrodon lividus]|nr:hypothetical protein BS17DRAFT_246713 [Gyrodon lividus]
MHHQYVYAVTKSLYILGILGKRKQGQRDHTASVNHVETTLGMARSTETHELTELCVYQGRVHRTMKTENLASYLYLACLTIMNVEAIPSLSGRPSFVDAGPWGRNTRELGLDRPASYGR